MKTKRNLWKAAIQYMINLFIVLLNLAIQLVAFWAMFESRYFLIFYLVLMVFSFLCVVSIYQSDDNSSYKMSWTILILMFPLFGLITYLFFGNGRTLPKKKIKKIDNYINKHIKENDNIYLLKQLDPIGYKHITILNSFARTPCYYNTECKFFSDTLDKFNALLEDIKHAKRYIFLEYFIIAKGYAFDRIMEELKKKAEEGVEIKIIYDDVGSKFVIKKRDVVKINAIKNIKMVAYNPMSYFVNWGMNYRDHRKIVVIDGNIAYNGGDNIADEYIHKIERFGFWRDNSIRLEGEAVYSYLLMFTQNWYICTKEQLEVDLYKGDCKIQTHRGVHAPYMDGPSNVRNPAYNLYRSLIENAQDYIYISTPYLIIDKEFLASLIKAKKSGVEVTLLLPGIPDKKLVYLVTRSHYRNLLKAGVKIYHFTPGFNHAKNFIIDDKYAVVGTINCDYRSLFLHFECADLMLYDPCISDIKSDYESAIAKSKQFTYEEWKKRSVFTKAVELLLTVVAPLL